MRHILKIANIIICIILIMAACKPQKNENVKPDGTVTIHPDKYKQKVLGLGFEIQSDAIGSGNTGLPEDKHAVPHDLTPSERERFSKEMLKGFRYCRLAGGLYWRGLDPDGKYLQPRWPEQLEELRQMLETAGVEGLSMEYWSPAPYWKANNSFVGEKEKQKYNTLRCFGPDFGKDPVYKGDTAKFLKDFADACVKDLQTLKAAGIKTVMWGMQNEPWVTNTQYSACKYNSDEDYIKAFVVSAGAVRKYDPNIMLFADTEHGFPKKIAKGMDRPEVAGLVDAYAVHTIGWDSERVKEVNDKIRAELPERPWFQNEYEYLQGGATADRCLNTVQHIMNSFQIGENPTWFWIHALKPFKNSEASGYSLGFWKSLDDTNQPNLTKKFERWVNGPEITKLPEGFENMEFVSVQRKSDTKPGLNFSFVLNQPATVYLVVEQLGDYKLDESWEKTGLTIEREGGTDVIYKKEMKTGNHSFPEHSGKKGETYGAPHACFIQGSQPSSLQIQVGVNSPIRILSEAMKLETAAAKLKPGHWFFNDFNWNAVGSFVKHMPWDCKVLDISEDNYNGDARVLAFERPNGKRTIVVSNRTDSTYVFKINTQLNEAKWRGYRYTPWERGKDTMGKEIEKEKGAEIITTLPNLSWEFWEEQ